MIKTQNPTDGGAQIEDHEQDENKTAADYLEDREWLLEQYKHRSKTVAKIADNLGVSEKKVREHLSDQSVYRLGADEVDIDTAQRLHYGDCEPFESEILSAARVASDQGPDGDMVLPEDVVAEHLRQHDITISEQHLRRAETRRESRDPDQDPDGIYTTGRDRRLRRGFSYMSNGGSNLVDGVVDEVREPTDPRLPELTTDDDIEALSDGSDLLRLRCGRVEHRTAVDRLLGSSSETDEIREVLVDLDGLDVAVGDEIVVEAIPIEEHDDPTVADLWLSTDESALARISRSAERVVGRLDVRADQLDEEMDLVPHMTRRQRVEIWIGRLNHRLSRLFGRVAR